MKKKIFSVKEEALENIKIMNIISNNISTDGLIELSLKNILSLMEILSSDFKLLEEIGFVDNRLNPSILISITNKDIDKIEPTLKKLSEKGYNCFISKENLEDSEQKTDRVRLCGDSGNPWEVEWQTQHQRTLHHILFKRGKLLKKNIYTNAHDMLRYELSDTSIVTITKPVELADININPQNVDELLALLETIIKEPLFINKYGEQNNDKQPTVVISSNDLENIDTQKLISLIQSKIKDNSLSFILSQGTIKNIGKQLVRYCGDAYGPEYRNKIAADSDAYYKEEEQYQYQQTHTLIRKTFSQEIKSNKSSKSPLPNNLALVISRKNILQNR